MFSALKLSRTHIRPSKCTLFNYAKTFMDGLYLFLSSKSSSSILFCHDIDAAWFQLKSNILKARDHAVPNYTISLHSSPKWFNSNLRHLIYILVGVCMYVFQKRLNRFAPDCEFRHKNDVDPSCPSYETKKLHFGP